MQWVVDRAVDYAVAHPPSSPEALERLERARLSSGIGRSALRHAAGDADDEVAVAALRAEVTDRGEAVRDAIGYLGSPRDNFLYDRAYRLLTAAVDGGPVRPLDPKMRDLFLAEERLGRLTLTDAFAYLAETEPRLREVEREIVDRRPEFEGEDGQQLMWKTIHARLEKLTGFDARRSGWLMRSDLTNDVALRYLLAVAGARGEDANLPLFARPDSCSRTHLLWGLRRPAAEN